jgi:SAM-dependent methyltransferase
VSLPAVTYLLGHDDREHDRLGEQHLLWREIILEPLRHAGLAPGARVLEVGCGPGDLLLDLAATAGRVVGIELDPKAAATARSRVRDAEIVEGDLMQVAIEERFDLVVARWVLSFMPDPAATLARLGHWLAPGGRIVVQDYNHDGVRVFPDAGGAIARAIDGVRARWRAEAGDLWVAARLPQLGAEVGLRTVSLSPFVKAGPPGRPVWRWVERFLSEHVDGVVSGGYLAAVDRDRYRAAWEAARADPRSALFSPMQVVAILERIPA